ncbi:MAG: amino acid ABC transporter substrate-binding protein [Clostridia bacterium]|nr:amino acid ABC transporter substrate-binding protein [Clostridia bacterium]
MKKIALLTSLVLTVAALSGCSMFQQQETSEPTEISVSDTSWEYIEQKGEFIIGLDDTFAPMGFRDEDGNLVGFDIDLATAVCAQMGVTAKFQPIDWVAKELELSGKKIDCIWNGMSKTPAREESMLLSAPYLNNTIDIMYMADKDPIATKADIIGKKIAVQAKSAALDALMAEDNYSDIAANISEYGTYDEAIMDLEIGRVDVVIIDEVLGRYKASKKPDTYAFAPEKLVDDYYVIGMRKGENALGEKLAAALDAVIESGEASQISVKWFGEDIVIK